MAMCCRIRAVATAVMLSTAMVEKSIRRVRSPSPSRTELWEGNLFIGNGSRCSPNQTKAKTNPRSPRM
eukprot:2107907-Pyramimonas_sp.AAC.1